MSDSYCKGCRSVSLTHEPGCPRLSKFSVCDPDYDDTAWTDVEIVGDAADAAERYARDRCASDPECYSSFDDPGHVVLVRTRGRTVPVKVTVSMEPCFSSRIMQ
jgi:hypothetical protein